MENRHLVSDLDLRELTGLIKPGAQARWLREHSVSYFLRRDGRPRTTWDAVNVVLFGIGATTSRPDFSQVR